MIENPLRIIGTLALVIGILLAFFPILSAPIVKHLGLWEAVFEVDGTWDTKILIGFWGYCTYKRVNAVLPGEHRSEMTCSKHQIGYSLKLRDVVPDAVGELKSGQTAFFLWSFVTVIIALAALVVSLSSDFKKFRIATFLSLVAGMSAYGNFLAFIVIFTGFTSLANRTDGPKTITIKTQIREDCLLPLAAGVFMTFNSAMLWFTYKEGLRKHHRNLRNNFSGVGREDESEVFSLDKAQNTSFMPKSILRNPNPTSKPTSQSENGSENIEEKKGSASEV
ncbi:hypothetical protein BY996DRAFT_6409931 [Phakopsora pachyrhizi]|uniref:Expressed protein n=1 Tax=Phakopsora pachyrhizi TaxID=170000 RepID=A0AAV0BNW7_PHAPC|nr:hypothetical protein BY996DRAFT_6409931 [Phakopsora pachyrhizi]CAH7688997.1 expressed protein [Phakopsora pachyrhizi]